MDTLASGPHIDSLPKIVFRSGPLRGQVLALDKDRTSIGRDARNDIAINDDIVSSFHAAIVQDGGVFYLEDAGSKNGTFLNGERVHRAALKDGDVFCLCQTGPEIQFSLGRPSLPTLMESTTTTFTRTRSLTQALRELLPRRAGAQAGGMSLTGVRRILDYKLEEATRKSRLQVIWIAGLFLTLCTATLVATMLIHHFHESSGAVPALAAGLAPGAPASSSSSLRVSLSLRLDPIYGSFFLAYRDTAIGEAEVTNVGEAPLSGAALELRFEGPAARFLIEPYSIPVPDLAPAGVARISVRPKLSNEVLASQTSEVTATVSVVRAGAQPVSLSRAVFVHGRNTFNWERPERIAVFVDPNDAAVVQLVGRVWGLRPSANRDEFPPPRVVGAITLLTGLANLGLNYRPDAANPISERIDQKAIDRVSYPGETILARSGDCDDLSVLGCAVLEAAGIPTAFAIGSGHVLFLLDTGIAAENLQQTPFDPETVVVWKDRVWMPIESTELAHPGANFASAWSAAWSRVPGLASGDMKLVELRDAWRSFQPMNPAPSETLLEQYSTAAQSAGAGLKELVAAAMEHVEALFRENLAKRVTEVSKQIEAGPAREQAIGLLYARSGLLSDAVKTFQRALFGEKGRPAQGLAEWGKEVAEETAVLLADLSMCLGLGAHTQEELDSAALYGEIALKGFPDGSRGKGELMLRVALVHRLRGDLSAERSWSVRALASDPTLGETYRRLTAAGGPVAGPSEEIREFLRRGVK